MNWVHPLPVLPHGLNGPGIGVLPQPVPLSIHLPEPLDGPKPLLRGPNSGHDPLVGSIGIEFHSTYSLKKAPAIRGMAAGGSRYARLLLEQGSGANPPLSERQIRLLYEYN